MSLSEALKAAARIIREAMASDSIGRYLLANMAGLITAAQVIATFGFDLFQDDDRVGATAEESILAGELLGLIAEAEGEDPPLPQIGPLTWITIAYQIIKLLMRFRSEEDNG